MKKKLFDLLKHASAVIGRKHISKIILFILLSSMFSTLNAQMKPPNIRKDLEQREQAAPPQNKPAQKQPQQTKPSNQKTEQKRSTATATTIEMVFVEGGTFTMGCTSEQGNHCFDDEKPAHTVTLSSYYIGKYEITQTQWKAVMGNNPSWFKGDNLPVEKVSWNDVQEFIRKLNAQTGKIYRLPTEAEWEYAARGGRNSRGYKYSGSNNLNDVAWYNGSRIHTVGSKNANELGIYDMSGNVKEWCQDWYASYNSSSQNNPQGPSSGSYRVHRGGHWSTNYAESCRVSSRGYESPDYSSMSLGLRVACSSK